MVHAKADNRVQGAFIPLIALSKMIWIRHMPSVVELEVMVVPPRNWIDASRGKRVHSAAKPQTAWSKLLWIHRMLSVVDLLFLGSLSVKGEYSLQFLL